MLLNRNYIVLIVLCIVIILFVAHTFANEIEDKPKFNNKRDFTGYPIFKIEEQYYIVTEKGRVKLEKNDIYTNTQGELRRVVDKGDGKYDDVKVGSIQDIISKFVYYKKFLTIVTPIIFILVFLLLFFLKRKKKHYV